MYTKITRSISVTVVPSFMAEQSDPGENHYVWAYTIQIENTGEETAQLINRYWHITDSQGSVQEVRGEGVIGEQPVLEPGDTYQYASGVALKTPSGIMTGHYELETMAGERFLVDIPAFSLDSPEQVSRPN